MGWGCQRSCHEDYVTLKMGGGVEWGGVGMSNDVNVHVTLMIEPGSGYDTQMM